MAQGPGQQAVVLWSTPYRISTSIRGARGLWRRNLTLYRSADRTWQNHVWGAQVVMDRKGRVTVIWAEENVIYAMRKRPHEAWTSPTPISRATGDHRSLCWDDAAIHSTVGRDGTILVTWLRCRVTQDDVHMRPSVHAVLRQPRHPWGPERTLARRTDGVAISASAAGVVANRGTGHVIWGDDLGRVFVATQATQAGWHRTQQLSPADTRYLSHLSLATSATGRVIAAWQSGTEVTTRTRDPGLGWTQPRTAAREVGWLWGLVADSAGRASVLFSRPSGAFGVDREATGPWHTPYRLGAIANCAVAANGPGDVIVACDEVTHYRRAGGVWERSGVFTQPTHDDHGEVLSVAPNGDALVVWLRRGTNFHLLARTYQPS